MRRIAAVGMFLLAIVGCETTRQCVTVSVETDVRSAAIEDPVKVRISYTLGEPPVATPPKTK